jgi:hypothetical protein
VNAIYNNKNYSPLKGQFTSIEVGLNIAVPTINNSQAKEIFLLRTWPEKAGHIQFLHKILTVV